MKLLVTRGCTAYHMILQFKIVAGSDWQLVSTDVSTLLSPYGVSSLPLQNGKVNFNEFIVTSLDRKGVVPQ